VKIGPIDYNLYTNSQVPTAEQINDMPIKTVGQASVLVGDVDERRTRNRSRPTSFVWTATIGVLPILKQGGDSNTIAVVDGIRESLFASRGYSEANW